MGYVHKTPAWAGPLGAKARRTYWGLVPTEPARGVRGLPPHPDEVPLPETFGQWYRTASAHLGLAERADLGLSRICAGAVLVLAQFAAQLPLVALLAEFAGVPVPRPATGLLVAGMVLLVVMPLCWARYRRSWSDAWRLRQAWSWAINDPAVLALPVEPADADPARDVDTDPEATHPYRARELFPIAPRPFVNRVIVAGSFSDRVRGREVLRFYLQVTLIVVSVIAALFAFLQLSGTGGPPMSAWTAVVVVTAALALLPALAAAMGRLVPRLLLAHHLAVVETDARERWIAWQAAGGPDVGKEGEPTPPSGIASGA
ncbi:hypothetical protein ACIGB8_09250 [Promicromonospora sukumoe]|uniref:hypothetical protein n=1 Tax=Promicromonospora sukumoe TaxID=88382 RepID=UPI0037CCADA9